MSLTKLMKIMGFASTLLAIAQTGIFLVKNNPNNSEPPTDIKVGSPLPVEVHAPQGRELSRLDSDPGSSSTKLPS
jgi:hypothetical protein